MCTDKSFLISTATFFKNILVTLKQMSFNKDYSTRCDLRHLNGIFSKHVFLKANRGPLKTRLLFYLHSIQSITVPLF